MYGYFYDLRTRFKKKAVEYVASGKSQAEAAVIFEISSRTIWNGIQRKKQGSLKPKSYETAPRKIDNNRLIHYIKQHPDDYLREIAEEFDVDLSSVFLCLQKIEAHFKKRRKIIESRTKRKGSLSLQT